MKEEILKILSEIRPEVNYELLDNYIEEGVLDSLDIILLVAKLDEVFSISIDGSDIIPENFMTTETIEALVKQKSSI